MTTSYTFIKCRSEFGLGDSLIDFIFFSKIAKYIESNNIEIHYQCKERYHANLQMFNSSNNIKLFPYSDEGYRMWQGPFLFEHSVNEMLCNMFNTFLYHHEIPIVIQRFEYDDADLLIKSVPSPVSEPVDILFINSAPTSGQYIHDKNELDDFIRSLSKKYRIAITERLDDIDAVLLDQCNVRQIAALAKTVKKVITINTGPSLGLYNKDILDNVEVVYILDTTEHYQFHNVRKFSKTRNVNGLRFLL